MRIARLTFQIAGVYGLLAVTPLFFLERVITTATPPAVTHPEYYYGFVIVTFAWQILFLVIARDPMSYRPMMLVACLEKVSGVAFIILVVLHRSPSSLLLLGSIDLCLGLAFLNAYRQTAPHSAKEQSADASIEVLRK